MALFDEKNLHFLGYTEHGNECMMVDDTVWQNIVLEKVTATSMVAVSPDCIHTSEPLETLGNIMNNTESGVICPIFNCKSLNG